MSRARASRSCAGLVCLAFLLPQPAAAYQQADLQGTWEFSSIASGPGAPWWERAHTVIAPDGSFTASTSNSSGGGDSFPGIFRLSSGLYLVSLRQGQNTRVARVVALR